MGFLRRYILSNWHLKLLSLLLAFVLWSGITGEPPAEVGFTVPLELQNIPEGLIVVGDVPSTVHVRLHGPGPLVRRLGASDVSVALNLAGLARGEHSFQLEPRQVLLPYGVRVTRLSPSQVRLRLEPAPALK